MTSLPIPVAVAMMLVILAAATYQQLSETATGRTFTLVLITYAMSMVFIGLRWHFDMLVFLKFAAVLAVASSVLLYLAFRSLGQQPVFALHKDWPHLLVIALMAAVTLLTPDLTDIALVLSKLLYAALLLRLARLAPSSLQLTRLDWLRNSHRALWGAAVLLLLSAVVDVAIAVDFIVNDGRNAASLVGVVNLFGVPLICWAAVQAGRGSVDNEPALPSQPLQPPQPNSAEANPPQVKSPVEPSTTHDIDSDSSKALLDQLNRLLTDEKLYADSNLNLQKLARKAGVPPRLISRTVNALTGQNVSQWVNRARIEAACTLLSSESMTVTQAMMDAGFSTKSNFNREFKRVTGLNPSDWRAQQHQHKTP
jgi:AraC-like DNA-binding protein